MTRPLRVLLCGDSDNGGGSWWLADALNRYAGCEAQAVRGYQSYIQYPADLVDPSMDVWAALVQWADVLHIRDRLPQVARRGPSLKGKPTVITFTGAIFRGEHAAVFNAVEACWQICVATPDMLVSCQSVAAHWLPNPREPMPQYRCPAEWFCLAQAPTSRSAKHTELLIRVAASCGVPLDVIEGVTYEESLKRKGRAWVVVDQFKYGYGNNAIEAWAMGLPVISGWCNHRDYRGVSVAIYGDPPPFAEARPNAPSICEAIERLRDDRSYYAEMVERGQDHFYRFHHAPVVARRAMEIYRMVLGWG